MKSRQKILAEQSILRKYYQNGRDAERERQVYILQLDIIPDMIGTGREEGREYNDFEYLSCTDLWQKNIIDFRAVARLYARLHSQKKNGDMVLCQIDTNPQNIVYVNQSDRYYLVDFVDWRLEYAEYDLIHFLLFWAAVKTHDEYIQIEQELLKAYAACRYIDFERWKKLVPQVIKYFDERRQYYGKIEKNMSSDNQVNRAHLVRCPRVFSVKIV
jgi:Ser/Thr protein kinase RdoA (MazF antagonist)